MIEHDYSEKQYVDQNTWPFGINLKLYHYCIYIFISVMF